MKEETKNEMDLLLRRLGRRDEVTVPNTDHLDADELSAYAENALPAAARARYTAHFAECSRCRELVVQLSSAVGVVASSETATVSKASAWRTFLASLFTPMVLRYAGPALGLIVVAGIAFVVLRSELAEKRAQVSNTEQTHVARAAPQPSTTFYDSTTNANSPSSPQQVQKEATKKQSPASPAPPNEAPVVTVNADLPVDKAAAQPKPEESKPEEQSTAANEVTPRKAEPTPATEASQKPAGAEANKKEVRGLYTAAPTAQRETRAEDKEKDARTPRDTDQISAGRVATMGSAAKLKRADASAGERSVAGRRFQKKGGVWIDTEYDSAKDVVSLTRGSEQYRALVADEPSIKTIADELEGEIIIVWKAHTYRIH